MKNSNRGFVFPLIIVLVALLAIGGVFIYVNKKTNVPAYTTTTLKTSSGDASILVGPSTGSGDILVGPNTAETKATFAAISEIKNATSVETCKKYEGNGDFSCITNLAVKQKSPELCDYFVSSSYYYNNPQFGLKNWCLGIYIANYNDKKVCSMMDQTFPDDYYRDLACPPASQTSLSPKEELPITLKINGSSDISNIKENDRILVTWTTSKGGLWTECDPFGMGFKRADGLGRWGDEKNQILPPYGSMVLIAEHVPISLGLSCFTNKQKNEGDRAYVGPLLK